MSKPIRQPQQERSIEKKQKIIEAGYQLFSEVGYHGTNTAEIARRAGVSTGIVYGYFQDKRDVMICVLQIYLEKVSAPIEEIVKKAQKPLNLPAAVKAVLQKTIEMHEQNAKLHNTLHALAAADEAVNSAFIALEDQLTQKFVQLLKDNGMDTPNLAEKVHLAMNIVQSFSHECVFDKHRYIDYAAMQDIVCNAIVALLR